jgi:predicted nucleic acid-binding protein
LLTTQAVLLEVGSALARVPLRRFALAIIDGVLHDPSVTVVPTSSELFERGLALFRDRPDRDWSLTDCISFLVMTDHGLKVALTSDRHFVQTGFRALLRE